MKSGLELHDSRVDTLELFNGNAIVHFSHAYIHKSKGTPGRNPGTGWSQEAQLLLSGVADGALLPVLPNTISEGYLEVGGIKHTVLPLPFKRKVDARLHLVFSDGTQLEIVGTRPIVELLGKPIYLEDFE